MTYEDDGGALNLSARCALPPPRNRLLGVGPPGSLLKVLDPGSVRTFPMPFDPANLGLEEKLDVCNPVALRH